ncbi:hypothetical protein EPR50_G00067940 [Perca flavescens]|uniref:C-type lectin domain-containing protein n=1 Tax=Perca flavescens TaxID=8167 RepID=A0A484DAJ1_PERFV|nr:hypothetical protein EPR50_G00067940 [Perca flavescens]
MGNKRSSELMLFCLFFAALCLKAFTTGITIYCPSQKLNWTDARLYCQRNHIDLVTWNVVNTSQLAKFLVGIKVQQAWIGLLRDPENATVWKWINVKSGTGISGDDLSQSSYWAHGEPSSNCAFVKEDLKWHSVTCSDAHDFYCSEKENTYYHNNSLNWHNASQYCKNESDGDLATITITNTDELKKPGLIGLYRQAGETWSWIGQQTSDYRNWAHGEPLTADCGSFYLENVTWHSSKCSDKLSFVCYDDDMVVVNENKTWEGALRHCRGMGTQCEDSLKPCTYLYDLLSLNVLSNYVIDRIYRATTDEVWTGLRFLGGEWWWADGEQLGDQGMLPDCLSQRKHCGTLSKYDTKNWITRDCSERRNFVCYKLFKERS